MLYSATVFRNDECGASAIEYAFLASLIAAVISGSVLILGGKVDGLYQSAVAIFP